MLKPGDICIEARGTRGDCWVIASVNPAENYPYLALSITKKKMFRSTGEPLIKIGELGPSWDAAGVHAALLEQPALPDETSAEFLRGRMHAEINARCGPEEDRPRWRRLADCRPGDLLTIVLGGRRQTVVFHRVLPRAERYVFLAADAKGRLVRYSLDVLPIYLEANPMAPADRQLPNQA